MLYYVVLLYVHIFIIFIQIDQNVFNSENKNERIDFRMMCSFVMCCDLCTLFMVFNILRLST